MNKECPKCGNIMTFNVITNTLDCTECGFQIDDDEDIISTSNSIEENQLEEEMIIDSEEEIEELSSSENETDFILYHCDDCNISFIGKNVDKCFICGSFLNKTTINNNYSKYIDFKLNLSDAIHNYKKHLVLKLLCPLKFRSNNTIKRIKGIYVPMYLFDVSLDGDVVFNASDINILDSSKSSKNIQYYKTICNGHFDYNNVLINASSIINNGILEKIDDFDYNELKEIETLELNDKVIYKEDCDEYNIYDRLKNRCSNNSVKLMGELVNHAKKKVVENKLVFNNDKKGIILVPVYFLINEYKGREYYYIMNGQNGNTYIKTPIGIIETIVFSILLFVILFVLMLLIAILI